MRALTRKGNSLHLAWDLLLLLIQKQAKISLWRFWGSSGK